jgi:hypothetical protein
LGPTSSLPYQLIVDPLLPSGTLNGNKVTLYSDLITRALGSIVSLYMLILHPSVVLQITQLVNLDSEYHPQLILSTNAGNPTSLASSIISTLKSHIQENNPFLSLS